MLNEAPHFTSTSPTLLLSVGNTASSSTLFRLCSFPTTSSPTQRQDGSRSGHCRLLSAIGSAEGYTHVTACETKATRLYLVTGHWTTTRRPTMETLKRKRSRSKLIEAYKKMRSDNPAESRQQCPLMEVFHQYGLLEMIVSNLYPDDLLALLLCSRSTHEAIAPRPGSLENLLGKLKCSGQGVNIRNKRHKKSTFFYAYDCIETIKCGANEPTTECRPCTRCKVSTCDECRIHCVYQSIYEDPFEEDELPNFSGFVLLSPHEIPILSPHHMDSGEAGSQWQDPSDGPHAPYHDQGFIDVPFDELSYGLPESVEDLLEVDLGSQTLAASASSSVAHPSPVLRALYQTTEQRKRWFCDDCLPPVAAQVQKSLPASQCQCTLRNRFLDRWLCLRCYEAEERDLDTAFVDQKEHCACGRKDGIKTCLWCWGEVAHPMLEFDEVQNGDRAENIDQQ